MTDSASMELGGIDSLLRKLDQVGADTPRLFLRSAKAAMVTHVETPAKLTAPKDTTTLIREIHTETVGNDTVRTGTKLKYGIYVERGTGIYATNGMGRKTPWVYYYAGRKGRRGFRRTVGQRPQPFLEPTWKNNKMRVIAQIKSSLKADLQNLTRT